MATSCIKCGSVAHRSSARTTIEKITKLFSNYRMYHCHDCHWRGALVKEKVTPSHNRVRTILLFILVLILTVIGASYMTGRMIQRNAPYNTVSDQ